MATGLERQLRRAERRGNLRAILRQPVLLAAAVCTLALLALFVGYPLLNILLLGLTDDSGSFSPAALWEVMCRPEYPAVFGRTILLGSVVAVLGTLVGYLFAYTITCVDVPCKKFLRAMATLPVLSPPFILSLSMIFLFGKQGLITDGLLGLSGHNVYGMGSLIVVQVMSFFPLAYFTASGALSAADASAEEAARGLGAGRGRVFRTVTLPMSLPGILSGGILILIQSLEDFSNPAVIGGSYTTLSVEIYQAITGRYDLRRGAALALLLLFPTLIAYLLHRRWIGGGHFVTVTGKAVRRRQMVSEWYIRWPLFGLCMLSSAVLLLFYGTAVFGSFVKAWGYDFTLTLDQYRRAIAWGLESLGNSVFLGLISALLGGILGLVIAVLTTGRTPCPGRTLLSGASVLLFAVPGAVLGIAYILAFNTGPLILTGTGTILVLAFTFRNMPVTIEACTAALLQIDGCIGEASAVLGAGPGHTFGHITLPLLRQAFFSGVVYAFTRALTAVSTAVFLVSPRWKLVTVQIYALFDEAKYSQAAALVTILVLVLAAFLGLLHVGLQLLLSPRRGQGRRKHQ